jgi:hypothetical protein
MCPGPIGEGGVGTRRRPLPQPLTGGTVTPTITPDIGLTTRRGPCIRPRLELFTCLRLGLCMRPYQGLGMAEGSSVPGSGYRYPEWGFRCRFTYRS